MPWLQKLRAATVRPLHCAILLVHITLMQLGCLFVTSNRVLLKVDSAVQPDRFSLTLIVARVDRVLKATQTLLRGGEIILNGAALDVPLIRQFQQLLVQYFLRTVVRGHWIIFQSRMSAPMIILYQFRLLKLFLGLDVGARLVPLQNFCAFVDSQCLSVEPSLNSDQLLEFNLFIFGIDLLYFWFVASIYIYHFSFIYISWLCRVSLIDLTIDCPKASNYEL